MDRPESGETPSPKRKKPTVELATVSGTGVVEVVIPSADSQIVQEEKGAFLGALDLETFVSDLGNLGSFINLAYNGIGAAGPEYQDLQNKVQRLGFDISKLCDKSAVTIAKFKTTTRTILDELKSAYEFLASNKESLALMSFSEFALLAEKMAKAAEQLQKEFESQEKKMLATLEETQQRGADSEIARSRIREQQEKNSMYLKEQEKLAKEYEKAEEEARKERRRAEKKEDKAMSGKKNILSRIGNALTSYAGFGNLFDTDSDYAERARYWREKSLRKLELEMEQRKLKQAAYQTMAELAHDIKVADKHQNLAKLAYESLTKASLTMRELIYLLAQAAIFWNSLKEHCQSLAQENLVQKYIAVLSPEERKEYWTSEQFKTKMYRYIAKWVALHSVCSAYFDQIKVTQRDVWNYMKQNPTYEESRQNLRELVEKFEENLRSAQERIAQHNSQNTKQIEQLSAEIKAIDY